MIAIRILSLLNNNVKVTVHDEYLEFQFKSGVTISIEM